MTTLVVLGLFDEQGNASGTVVAAPHPYFTGHRLDEYLGAALRGVFTAGWTANLAVVEDSRLVRT